MSDFVVLSCPSCGGKLEISKDVNQFACAYCGNESVVRRGGGIVSLDLVDRKLGEIKDGVNLTASELAIQRLTKEINYLKLERSTIFGDSKYKVGEGCTSWLYLGIVLTGIFSLLMLIPVEELGRQLMSYSVAICILLICILIVSKLVAAEDQRNLDKLKEKEMEPINKLLQSKLEELEIHQKRVSIQNPSSSLSDK